MRKPDAKLPEQTVSGFLTKQAFIREKHAPILKLTILFTNNLGYTIRVIKRQNSKKLTDETHWLKRTAGHKDF